MTTKSKNNLETLKNLASNNTLSSMQICLSMIDSAVGAFKNKETPNLVYEIVKQQSSMAAVINTGLKILKALKDNNPDNLQIIKDDLKYLSKLAVEEAADFLSGVRNIATISFSQSVFELIKILEPKKVFLSVAHPAKEGEKFANILKAYGIEPVLLEDCSYSHILKSVDCVAVGADAVFDDSFINKTGTLSLALLSKYFNIPFYVIGCSCKYLDEEGRRFFKITRKPQGEISTLDCERVNVYFEEIPDKFVNKMFMR